MDVAPLGVVAPEIEHHMARCFLDPLAPCRDASPANRRSRASAVIARGLFLVAVLWSTSALADDHTPGDLDRTIIVGIGGAAEREIGDGALHSGANVMVEWETIEDRLELELGISALAANGATEIPIDVVAKRPFRLSRRSELMIGLGPEVVRTTGAQKATHVGGEVALDYMFWPSPRVGVWAEPSYEAIVRDGVASGIAVTGGVMFGW